MTRRSCRAKPKESAAPAKKEVCIARSVNRKEMDATRLYLREIEFSPLLTAKKKFITLVFP